MKFLLLFLLFPSCCYAMDIQCIAKAVYFEARGESIAGQAAIAQVIMNRVQSEAYPSVPCKVVKQRKRGVWQFSFWNRDSFSVKKERFNLTLSVTQCVVDGYCSIPGVGESTLYYACDGRYKIHFPSNWDKSKLEFTTKVGSHCFYKEK